MGETGAYDLAVVGGDVVFPGRGVRRVDIGISGERIAAIAERLSAPAARTIDAAGRLVFPGLVDSHVHLGIFRPLADDAPAETGSAVAGGVTTSLVYYRAGRHNLVADENPELPAAYAALLPALLAESAGAFRCDYGYHIAPVTREHAEEVPALARRHGITGFKYYMHYTGVTPAQYESGLHPEKEFLFSDVPYDLGYLHRVMERVADANHRAPAGAPAARVCVHAESPALIREGTERVLADLASGAGDAPGPLEAYSRSRPTGGERLGILDAAELAARAGAPLTVLHVSSADALDAVREARSRYPELDLACEATVHHLSLAAAELEGWEAKVNPPLRAAGDRDALWQGVADGSVQTIASDHAAIARSLKAGSVWQAWYGFGGNELLLPAAITEGHIRRQIPLERLAEALALAPARLHGLAGRKGDIAIGLDADLAICDPEHERTVDPAALHSAQDFSPFAGRSLRGWVDTTILRGEVCYEQGRVVGPPRGRHVRGAASPAPAGHG
ncbi:MAG: dihydroorotase family protein [Chloroflexi bacterium]|nr:dihydroorotase family protein [Chloroflexota bacterium]